MVGITLFGQKPTIHFTIGFTIGRRKTDHSNQQPFHLQTDPLNGKYDLGNHNGQGSVKGR